MKHVRHPLALALLASALPAIAADTTPDLDALRAELAQQRALIDAQQQQIEALAASQESAPAAAGNDTTLGLYGELHYNGREVADAATGKANIHAHRFVVLLAHRFRDDLQFFSELEFEGAPDSTEVETELEQFGLAWQVHDRVQLTMGQFLVPVGLLNETHEPEAFYGVERNPVEEFVIPATWWEKGVMAGIRLDDAWHLDLAVHNGLRGDVATLGGAEGLREFRQEFGGARVEDPAFTARLRYAPVAGLALGATLQRQANITQSNDPLTGGRAPATLLEIHAVWQQGAFTLRALGARWLIDNTNAAALGTDELSGAYLEPSWKVSESVGVFARVNRWNTATNATGSRDSEQVNAGVNWWLHPRVVLKADLQDTNQAGGAGDGFNLGMGVSF